MLIGLAIIVACAVAFRLRGSELWNDLTHTGTTGGRLFWSFVAGLALWGAHAHTFYVWVMPLFIGLAFAGAVAGWPSSIDLGRNEGTWLQDFFLHSLRGMLFTLPLGVPFLFTGNYTAMFILADWGLAAGMLYELAWRWPIRRVYVREVEIVGQGVPLGELLFGAWIGLGIVVSGAV